MRTPSFLRLSSQSSEMLLWPFLLLLISWFTLALSGLFSPFPVGFFFLICLAAELLLVWQQRLRISFHQLLIIILGLGLLLGIFMTHPLELTDGRDQGSYAEAALQLVQAHSLFFHSTEARAFFDHYGPGKALNFPGFYYTEKGDLLTQFPIGYIAWLAGFTTLFGTVGFALANGTLFLGSLLLLAVILKEKSSPFFMWLGSALFALNFLPLWFLSFTLSENLALTLFLALVFAALRFHNRPSRSGSLLLLSIAFIFCFTRIEGWFFLLFTLFFLGLHRFTRQTLWKKDFFYSLTLPFILFFFSVLALFLINAPYFVTIAKALLHLDDSSSAASPSLLAGNLWAPFALYGLLGLCLAACASALYLAYHKRWSELIPLYFALPTVFYLIAPTITYDPPWMLRRYLFSLLPLFIILIVLAAFFWYQRERARRARLSAVILLFFLLFIAQAPALYFYWQTRFSSTVRTQAEMLSQRFSSQDLVLVDRDVTGSGYALITLALRTSGHLHAAYFFNPEDLSRISTSDFEHVFLLVPESKQSSYLSITHESESVGEFTYNNDHVLVPAPADSLFGFPTMQSVAIKNVILKLR